MDSLGDVLAKRAPQEPAEVARIKQFVQEQFSAPCSVLVQERAIIITVRSAALANSLRLRTPDLQAAADTQKRLVLRIG